ncbi:hypothetical protein F4801DRAFT_556635 [Xylaria longipes]|nr:hypothetical protein F4801DRAFT_556635 [Xylaria longipes]
MPSIRDDLQHYYLPIGVLGLVNQVVNLYIYLVFIAGRRPLWPCRAIQRRGYSAILCCVVMTFVLGFDSASSSRLERWELITSVVGNLVLFLSYLVIAALSVGHSQAKQAKAEPGPQADADGTSQTATAYEEPPPSYSEDPERGEASIDDKTQASNLGLSYTPDHEFIEAPEYPVNQMPSKENELMESSSTPLMAQEDLTNPPPVQTQAQTQTRSQALTKALALALAQKEPDTSATSYYLIFNIQGSILVLTGLVGQLAHNLPADWVHMGQIRSIIIAFSMLLAATAVGTLVRLHRLMRGQAWSDKGLVLLKSNNYSYCLLQGAIALSFIIVSFDKWLLAALANDITGTRHILSDAGLPLVYMVITKLPALAL